MSDVNYLTAEDVAVRLRCSRDTVRRLCNGKKLTATKVGRQWLIAEPDLNGFMAKYRGGSTPPARTTQTVRRGRRRVA